MLETSVIRVEDDLALLVDEINGASWDAANDLALFDVPSLVAYLERQDTVFVTCHEKKPALRTLMGFASSRFEIKPYGGERWLYVDELDVCTDQRQKGAGTAIMQKLIDLARQAGCEEVWLGTEVDNVSANALYKSLDPDEVDTFIGYAYELDE